MHVVDIVMTSVVTFWLIIVVAISGLEQWTISTLKHNMLASAGQMADMLAQHVWPNTWHVLDIHWHENYLFIHIR